MHPLTKRRTFPKWYVAAIAVLAAVVAVVVLIRPSLFDVEKEDPIAADTMSRSVSTGWESADTGGIYTVFPNGPESVSTGSVSHGSGHLVSSDAGTTAAMTLEAVKAQDVESSIDISLPDLPTPGSKVYITHFVRGTYNTGYGLMMLIDSTGQSYMILQRKTEGVETKFTTAAGPRFVAGETVSLKLSVVGHEYVQLGAKAWKTGTSEPTEWMIQGVDTEAERITTAGSIGVSVYASASGEVTPVSFDNLYTIAIKSDPSESLPNYAGRRMLSGSAQLNTLSYPIPSSAVYVATDGSDSNAGTKAKPFKTISAATKAAKANGTVVVRGGVYHESVLIYPRAGLTVQAYPKETVWLDGSEQVTGWTKSGSVWVKSNWATFFDASPTHTKGAADGTAENWQWINPAYPMAAHPDQIWLDDVPLIQVASREEVTADTFFVDTSAMQLVIGSDPSSKRVDVSTLAEAMSIRSTNSVIRGIGVRRYATSVPMMGSVTTYYNGVTLENVMIVDNATTGLFIGSKNVTLRNVTLRNNGLLGMGANNADNLKVESVFSMGNNSQYFNYGPVSGAMKITRSRQVSVQGSAFVNNFGHGPWFDESVYDTTFVHNDVVNNDGNGVTFELSDTVKAVDNLIVGNRQKGMVVLCTGNVAIWNNTFAGNNTSLDIAQDDRRASDLSLPGHDDRQKLPDPTMPWITKNVTLVNNVFSQSTGEAVMRVNDWSKEFESSEMLTKSDGNLFHTTSSSLPIAAWYPDGKTWTVYDTFSAYQSATGLDQNSLGITGASPLTEHFSLSSDNRQYASNTVPITASIANVSLALKEDMHVLGAVIR